MKGKTHIDFGIRQILEFPQIYNFKRILFGGNNYKAKYYNELFCKPHIKSVLDIGCGTGEMLQYLPKSVDYVGLDMEEKYIKYCQEQYSIYPKAKFFLESVGEVYHQEWENSFDAINAHGLMHHLADSDCKTLLKHCYNYLKPGGFLITVDSVFYSKQGFLSRFLVSLDRGQNIKTPSGYLEVASKVFDEIDGELITNHIRIPYSIYRMICVKR